MSKVDLSEWSWRTYVYHGKQFFEWTDPEGRTQFICAMVRMGPRRCRRYVERLAATRKAKGAA